MMIEFDIISREQVRGLLDLYNIVISDKMFNGVYDLCKKHKLTPCVISAFLFRHRKNQETFDTTCIELFKAYLKEIEVALDDSISDNLYT